MTMEWKRTILVTGGAGFIGNHVVRLFVEKYPCYRIINLDKLTYAGNLANLKDVEDKPNYSFVKTDICDYETVRKVIADNDVTGIIHLAAESHVDRSILDPFTFAKTNVLGTLTLLQAARIFPRTKFTVPSNSPSLKAIRHTETNSSRRVPNTSRTVPIPRPRLQATTS